MQIVEADRRIWRSIPGRLATIVMAVAAGAFALPAGIVAGVVAFFTLCLVRRQFSWFPGRPAWGYISLILVPLSRVLFWVSLAFLLFGLWRQGINPLWGLPLIAGWRVGIMLVERSRLSLQ